MIAFLDLQKINARHQEAFIAKTTEIINKGWYILGDEVQQFEIDFAKFVNSKYAVMVNSGSSANLLAVGALFYTKNPKLKRGDEVIVPAVSWSTTYYPLYQYGLKLKFVDLCYSRQLFLINMLMKRLKN